MAATAKPYGLRPINILGGQANSGSTRMYPISSAYATGMCYGDTVTIGTDGFIAKFTGTTTATIPPVGVFMGCEYQSATQGLLQRNQWTASTAIPTGTKAWAYVVDDPDALFEVQADGTVAQHGLGSNVSLIQTAGNTATGMSKVAISAASIATTATLPIRVVDFVRRPDTLVGDAFTDLIVRFNIHFHRQATGIVPA